MLTENRIKQQLAAAKAMQERFELIATIAAKYGGEAFAIHEEIQVYIPEVKYDEFTKEFNNVI